MKHWEKVLRRASQIDQKMVLGVLAKLKRGQFPPDTIKLKGTEQYRTRVGNWRIIFHYDNEHFALEDIERRNGHNY